MMNEESVLHARREIEEALDMLNRQHIPSEMMCRIAAAVIVGAMTPLQNRSLGSEYYRIKAEDWLTLLLSEPGLTIGVLAQRVDALASVSANIKDEIGVLASRLLVVSGAAGEV